MSKVIEIPVNCEYRHYTTATVPFGPLTHLATTWFTVAMTREVGIRLENTSGLRVIFNDVEK